MADKPRTIQELESLLDEQQNEQIIAVDPDGSLRPMEAPSGLSRRPVVLHDPHGEY